MKTIKFLMLTGILIVSYYSLLKIDIVMADQKTGVEDLKKVTAQLQKISAESSKTLEKVSALEAAASEAGGISPELQAAIDEVKNQAQIVDDLTPDLEAPGGTQL